MKRFFSGTMGRTMIAVLTLILAMGVVTACMKDKSGDQEGGIPAPSTGDSTKKSDPNAGGTDQSGSKGGGGAVQLTPVTYDDTTKKIIGDTAKNAGVTTVYVPQQVTAEDKLDQVQGSGTEMTIKFYKMAIVESKQELKPAGQTEPGKSVSLKTGSGQWITAAGKSALYLKVGDTYVALSSESVPQAEIEAVAETLVPLQ